MTYLSCSYSLYEEALRGEILRSEVGSTLHGTGLPGHEDRDEVGITVMSKRNVLGMKPFEQLVWRTADGPSVRSTPDDTDLAIYSLQKWLKLAMDGNPSILIPIWAPSDRLVSVTPTGLYLRGCKQDFISKNAGKRFLGYATSQRKRMEDSHAGVRSPRVNRPELIEVYGYDTKFAMHMLRLCAQGSELLLTGTVELPISYPVGETLRAVRRGEFTYEEIIEMANDGEDSLRRTIEDCDWPEQVDVNKINELSMILHERAWAAE